MTTDTFPKGAVARLELDGVPVTIMGFAKGSGMIAPDMATMLVYLFTDAAVPRPLLQAMVAGSADETFNCITVDGDTSTSDTLIMAATGRAPMAPLEARRAAGGAFRRGADRGDARPRASRWCGTARARRSSSRSG